MLGDGVRRRARARRMMRRLQELDRVDALYGVGATPPPRRGARWRLLVVMVVCWGGFAWIVASGVLSDRHNAAAPPVPTSGGEYKFLQVQSDGKTPVAWDPCRTIRLEINPEGAPDRYKTLVLTAMRHITQTTGVRFELVGLTDSDRFLDEQHSSPAVPVIVAWTTAREMPALEGDVAGQGGATWIELGGFKRYVGGAVVLDADAFARIDDQETRQAIVDHEFGHLIGLDHVKDRGELMYSESIGQTTWGPGDLEGLARLGQVRCR